MSYLSGVRAIVGLAYDLTGVAFRSRSVPSHAFGVLIYFERESPKEVKIGIRFTILTASFLFPEATNATLTLSILGGGTVTGRIARDL